jgi:N-acetylglucosamine-6-phosphate deacetylase
MIGLSDRGQLAVGMRADLCHLDAGLQITGVWASGRPVRGVSS